MNRLLQKLTWTAIVSIGIGVFAGGGLSLWDEWLRKSNTQVVEVVPLNQIRSEPIKDAVPRSIEIPTLGVDVEVVPGLVKRGEWQVADKKANYLVGSGVIASGSNTVIYAHKRPGLFGDLSKIKAGDEITVRGKDVKGTYVVERAFETDITDLDILEDTHSSTLTLYTCNRWDDSTRYVVVASLTKETATSLIGIINAAHDVQ